MSHNNIFLSHHFCHFLILLFLLSVSVDNLKIICISDIFFVFLPYINGYGEEFNESKLSSF